MKKLFQLTKYKRYSLVIKDNFLILKGISNDVKFKLDSLRFFFIDKVQKFYISKYYLNSFLTLIKNLSRILFFGLKKKLKVVGLGFRVFLFKKDIVRVDLGYSHVILLKLPNNVFLKCNGDQFLVYGFNFLEVNKMVQILKLFKKKDVYKGKGIYDHDKELKLKEGKVRTT